MVSLGPYTPSTDYSHMYSFVDYRSKTCPQIRVNKGSIYDLLISNPKFSRFAQIVERARMSAQLNESEANFTIFIPTNDYLSHLPEDFFQTMDDGLARQILKASSLDNKIDKDLLTSSPCSYFITKNPKMRLYVTNIDGVLRINNCLGIVKYDINLTNGMVHVVSGLIVPSEDHFMN